VSDLCNRGLNRAPHLAREGAACFLGTVPTEETSTTRTIMHREGGNRRRVRGQTDQPIHRILGVAAARLMLKAPVLALATRIVRSSFAETSKKRGRVGVVCAKRRVLAAKAFESLRGAQHSLPLPYLLKIHGERVLEAVIV
jgi:hypothetical protein